MLATDTKQKHTNYSLAILASAGMGSLLFSFALGMHDVNLSSTLSCWLLGLESTLLTSQAVSGNGYFSQFIDKISGEGTLVELKSLFGQKNSFSKRLTKRLKSLFQDYTFIGLGLGLLSAIAITVIQFLLHSFAPFTGYFSFLREPMLLIGNMSSNGGLGNRLGRAAKNLKEKEQKDKNYAYSIVCGVLGGLVLTAVTLGAHFVTGGILPLVLTGVSLIGGSASAAGYLGRVCDFICQHRPVHQVIKEKLCDKENKGTQLKLNKSRENILTSIGVVLGIALGIGLICAGIMTLPLFGIGLPKTLAGICLLSTCISGLGGLGNRIGHALDKKGLTKTGTYNTATSGLGRKTENSTHDNESVLCRSA